MLPESVASSRSTTLLEASTPEPASEPLSSVSGTDAVVYHGPPESAADWPLGADESATIESRSYAGRLAPSVVSTLTVDGPAAPDVHA